MLMLLLLRRRTARLECPAFYMENTSNSCTRPSNFAAGEAAFDCPRIRSPFGVDVNRVLKLV